MSHYYNVPSDGAITRRQAIVKAADLGMFNPGYHAGICYQGDLGSEIYIDNLDFTNAEALLLGI